MIICSQPLVLKILISIKNFNYIYLLIILLYESFFIHILNSHIDYLCTFIVICLVYFLFHQLYVLKLNQQLIIKVHFKFLEKYNLHFFIMLKIIVLYYHFLIIIIKFLKNYLNLENHISHYDHESQYFIWHIIITLL